MISLVLQAGKFGPKDTEFAAYALIWYALGVFAWGGQAVVARGFYAIQDTVTPVVIGTIMTIIFVPLNWGLMKLMGYGGLALATSVMAIIYLVALLAVLAKRVQGIGAWRILNSTAKITAASVIAGAAAYLVSIMPAFSHHSSNVVHVKAAAAAQLVPSLAVGCFVYLFCCSLFKVEESRAFKDMLVTRLRKKKPAAV